MSCERSKKKKKAKIIDYPENVSLVNHENRWESSDTYGAAAAGGPLAEDLCSG